MADDEGTIGVDEFIDKLQQLLARVKMPKQTDSIEVVMTYPKSRRTIGNSTKQLRIELTEY